MGWMMSPVEFAEFVLGVHLYDWQAEACFFAVHGRRRVALVAANGSGKTACVNVVLLLWFLHSFPQGIAMVTSGSWNQLATQLWPNLEMHRAKFPSWQWGKERISTPHGGFIQAYSTIQPGRAEGHHQHLPERPVMLMVDEAKSVPEGIFQALSRCTPTYYVLTSSPGGASGSFYQAFHRARALYHTVRARASDCPHISPEKIRLAQELYGPDYEQDPIYRSMILAEFSEGEESCIIPRRYVERALAYKAAVREGVAYTAVDWAAGGDETVLAERRGNQLRILYRDHERDTVLAAARIVRVCRERGVDPAHCFGDVCGLGIGIMQAAEAMHGWRFREFNGGAPAGDKAHFFNANIEAWHYFRKSLERGEVCFPDGLDEESVSQLCNRYLVVTENGRLRCETKADMKGRGLHSPDRADALVMAWWVGRFMDYADESVVPVEPSPLSYEPLPDYIPGLVL